MSSESLSSTLSEYRDGLAQSYLVACSAAAVLYEWILSLYPIIRFSRISKAKDLVTISLVNHCFMLGMAIGFILSSIPVDHKLVVTCGDSTAMFTIHSYALFSCKTLGIWIVLCPTVPTTLWAVFSSLRIYAVCGGSRCVSLLTLLPGVAPTAVDVTTICISSWNDSCVQYVNVTEAVAKSLSAVSRSSALASDVIVIIATWWRLHSAFRNALSGTKPTLVQTLCRDGSIYFLVLAILNGITIALWYLKISDDFALIASSATSIAISRFTLNMQDACFDLQDPTGLGLSYMSRMQTTLQFDHQIDTEQPSTDPAMGDAYDQASFNYD